MRFAQFYALAIFFMYRLCPRKGGVSTSGIAVELARKAIPLVETQSSSWSVSLYMIFFFRIIWRRIAIISKCCSLYMIFCFVSSGDGKAICHNVIFIVNSVYAEKQKLSNNHDMSVKI